MVMPQAGRLAVSGIVAGLAAASLASRALRSQRFEVSPTELTAALVALRRGVL
jgi:hypothetical protein